MEKILLAGLKIWNSRWQRIANKHKSQTKIHWQLKKTEHVTLLDSSDSDRMSLKVPADTECEMLDSKVFDVVPDSKCGGGLDLALRAWRKTCSFNSLKSPWTLYKWHCPVHCISNKRKRQWLYWHIGVKKKKYRYWTIFFFSDCHTLPGKKYSCEKQIVWCRLYLSAFPTVANLKWG